jgi:hypothetical protein
VLVGGISILSKQATKAALKGYSIRVLGLRVENSKQPSSCTKSVCLSRLRLFIFYLSVYTFLSVHISDKRFLTICPSTVESLVIASISLCLDIHRPNQMAPS